MSHTGKFVTILIVLTEYRKHSTEFLQIWPFPHIFFFFPIVNTCCVRLLVA